MNRENPLSIRRGQSLGELNNSTLHILKLFEIVAKHEREFRHEKREHFRISDSIVITYKL